MKNCTTENPMPPTEKNIKEGGWMHHDVTELEDLDTFGVKFKCNSCGYVFIVRDMP